MLFLTRSDTIHAVGVRRHTKMFFWLQIKFNVFFFYPDGHPPEKCFFDKKWHCVFWPDTHQLVTWTWEVIILWHCAAQFHKTGHALFTVAQPVQPQCHEIPPIVLPVDSLGRQIVVRHMTLCTMSCSTGAFPPEVHKAEPLSLIILWPSLEMSIDADLTTIALFPWGFTQVLQYAAGTSPKFNAFTPPPPSWHCVGL